MPIDPNGPAYPVPAHVDTRNGTLPDGDRFVEPQPGLPVRALIATMLLGQFRQAPSSVQSDTERRDTAIEDAVTYADALIARLNRVDPRPTRPE